MATASRYAPFNSENSGQGLLYEYQAPVQTAATTIVNLATTKAQTVVQINGLSAAFTINAAVGSNGVAPFNIPNGSGLPVVAPYAGDGMQMLIYSLAGTTITFGTGFSVSAATLIVSATKRNSISFIFDGTVFVETGRAVGI